jgi:hypothetical protein
MELIINIDTSKIDRENICTLLEDCDFDTKGKTDEELVIQYTWITLGSNMDVDSTGLVIKSIEEG